jgi:hypothetical protein
LYQKTILGAVDNREAMRFIIIFIGKAIGST